MPVRLGRRRRTPGRPVAGLKPTGDMPHRTMLIHPFEHSGRSLADFARSLREPTPLRRVADLEKYVNGAVQGLAAVAILQKVGRNLPTRLIVTIGLTRKKEYWGE